MQWINSLPAEMGPGQCAHGFRGSLVAEGTELQSALGESDAALNRPMRDIDDSNDSYFGVFMERPGTLQDVEVLARYKSDPRYAAVAREGALTVVCVNAPPSEWSPGLRSIVGDLVRQPGPPADAKSAAAGG
ncbi:MAG: hypothetical protein R3F49_21765 [Planctomycetota bacterium]